MIYSYKDSYHGEQISPLFSLAGTLGIPNMYMKYTIRNYYHKYRNSMISDLSILARNPS
jgi:hypothetical protein